MAFGFDYCYWSVNPEDPNYASQEVVMSSSLHSPFLQMFAVNLLFKSIMAVAGWQYSNQYFNIWEISMQTGFPEENECTVDC